MLIFARAPCCGVEDGLGRDQGEAVKRLLSQSRQELVMLGPRQRQWGWKGGVRMDYAGSSACWTWLLTPCEAEGREGPRGARRLGR